MAESPRPGASRVLLLPPTRRDAAAIEKLLGDAGIACHPCGSMAELCAAVAEGAAAVIVSEESLAAEASALAACLSEQPVWSDLPVIVLSRGGAESAALGSILPTLGNASVMERPVRVSTFLSVIRTALRARDRQYQVRDHLLAREASEAALRRSREQQEMVVRGADVGVWYCPLPFDRLIWDETVKRHFHLPADAEVTIDTFYERLHDEDRQRVRQAIDESITARAPYDIDYRTVSPDGSSIKWIRAIGRGFYDDDGQPQRFDGITIDVTERVQSEIALRTSEQRLRAVVDASPECVKIVSPEGTLMYMNAAGLGMVEAGSLEDVKDSCVFDMIANEHREEWASRHARVCAGEKLNWQFEIVSLGGTRRWMDTHAVPLPLPDGRTAHLAVTRDVTAKKLAEIEREQLLESERAARSELERASRMKDEFLATLSHELRNPLNAILGWTQILQMGDASSAEVAEGLEIIERNARAQTQIIEDLLDMSRIISGKVRLDVQRIDLAAVLRAAIETVKPAADAKGIRLRAVLDPLAAPVSGDPSRLQQVFWNLLSNAVKFTPKEGAVQIVLERVNSHVEVSVIDNGEGIAPEFLPHVFDRFRQADATTTRRHAGLGLGLALVRQLVELHGGSVHAKSGGRGQGATFVVGLPLTVVHAARDADADRRHPATSPERVRADVCVDLEGLRVVVVDDEPDARALLHRLLDECGAQVFAAASASEAATLVERERPDVLVSDIGMPGQDGYALIRRIRALPDERGGLTPAIALTAYARAEDRVNVVVAGFQHHLSKPVEPTELIAIVASLANRRS
jgi:PAS domain S-box-containing protein